MQTASGTLAAAITTPERTPVIRVKADWARNGTYVYDPGVIDDVFIDTFTGAGDMADLSDWVETVTVDRSLSTDLPEAAKVGSGFGAAEATITLSGNLSGGPSLLRALSAHQGGAGTFTRMGTPITVDVGFVGDAGPEYLRQFTGKVRSVSLDPDSRSVTLTALDGRELLRTPVSLTVVTNTTGTFFINAIATANGVTPTMDTSLNTSVSTPSLDTSDPWELLQQIAAAESGSILFDENNTLRFYNWLRMLSGSAVATITTDPDTFANLKTRGSEETIDSVRNYVIVPAAPLELDPVGTIIWSAGETLEVLPISSRTVPVDLPGGLVSLTAISYLAAKNSNGTGGDITNLSLSYTSNGPASGVINVFNPNAFSAFLVGNSTTPATQGQPMLTLTGRTLRPALDGGYTAVRADQPSQNQYGTQPLDVASNVWRQSASLADSLATLLLAGLKDPHPTLSGVEIVGDPRLQLVDRVRVVDPDGLYLDGEFWLTAINTSAGASGLAQTVSLRRA